MDASMPSLTSLIESAESIGIDIPNPGVVEKHLSASDLKLVVPSKPISFALPSGKPQFT